MSESIATNDGVEVLRITKKRKSVPLEIEEENGTISKYYLREMTGTLRDHWLNRMQKQVKADPKTKTGTVTDHTGLYASLIASCCFTSDGKPLHESEVQGWPSSQQEEVFKVCEKMNGLDKKSQDDEKKE